MGKMKTAIILFTIIVLMSASVFAQIKFALSITGGVNFGLSDFGAKYSNGYNGTATLIYSAAVSLTFSIGYNKWNKEELSFTSIPLLAGFRFYFPVHGLKFYLPGYLGLHITTSAAELPTAVINGEIKGGNVVSFSNNHFGFGIGAGVLVPLSQTISLDINATFNSISASESNLNYISINGGFQFEI